MKPTLFQQIKNYLSRKSREDNSGFFLMKINKDSVDTFRENVTTDRAMLCLATHLYCDEEAERCFRRHVNFYEEIERCRREAIVELLAREGGKCTAS